MAGGGGVWCMAFGELEHWGLHIPDKKQIFVSIFNWEKTNRGQLSTRRSVSPLTCMLGHHSHRHFSIQWGYDLWLGTAFLLDIWIWNKAYICNQYWIKHILNHYQLDKQVHCVLQHLTPQSHEPHQHRTVPTPDTKAGVHSYFWPQNTLSNPKSKIAHEVFQTIKLAAAAAFQTNIITADWDPV